MDDPGMSLRHLAVLTEHLEGTPAGGDEGQLRRLLELDVLHRIAVVSVLVEGEAATVDEAVDVLRGAFGPRP